MSEQPWYENSNNVLNLAKWMDNTNYASRDDIVKMLHYPHHRHVAWTAYQASLQPKEPTLSEQILAEHGVGWLHVLATEVERQFDEMAQRIEALEEKVGE